MASIVCKVEPAWGALIGAGSSTCFGSRSEYWRHSHNRIFLLTLYQTCVKDEALSCKPRRANNFEGRLSYDTGKINFQELQRRVWNQFRHVFENSASNLRRPLLVQEVNQVLIPQYEQVHFIRSSRWYCIHICKHISFLPPSSLARPLLPSLPSLPLSLPQ